MSLLRDLQDFGIDVELSGDSDLEFYLTIKGQEFCITRGILDGLSDCDVCDLINDICEGRRAEKSERMVDEWIERRVCG